MIPSIKARRLSAHPEIFSIFILLVGYIDFFAVAMKKLAKIASNGCVVELKPKMKIVRQLRSIFHVDVDMLDKSTIFSEHVKH